jgi:hypothetical protein
MQSSTFVIFHRPEFTINTNVPGYKITCLEENCTQFKICYVHEAASQSLRSSFFLRWPRNYSKFMEHVTHYYVHRNTPPVSTLTHIDQVHIMSHINIVFAPTSRSSKRFLSFETSTKIMYNLHVSSLPCVLHVTPI